jgi:hypothetical protein
MNSIGASNGRGIRMAGSVFLIATSYLAGISIAFAQNTDSTDLLNDAFDAWARRQGATRSIAFLWHQGVLLRKLQLVPSNTASTSSSSEPAPLLRIEQDIAFYIDGDRFSYNVDTKGAKALDMPPVYKSTFDGTNSQMYATIEPDMPTNRTGVGMETDKRLQFDGDSISIRPVALLLRPFHPELGRVNRADFRLAKERQTIGSVSCIVIEHAGDQQPHRFFWVDPARAYLLLRETETYRGRERIRKDISYKPDANGGWLPAGWKTVTLDERGELRESITATVSQATINGPIDNSHFHIEFPKGTQLTNERNGVGKTIVLGASNDSMERSSGKWLLFVNLLAIILIGAVFFVRKYWGRLR